MSTASIVRSDEGGIAVQNHINESPRSVRTYEHTAYCCGLAVRFDLSGFVYVDPYIILE